MVLKNIENKSKNTWRPPYTSRISDAMLAKYDEDKFEYWDDEGTNQGWEKQKPGPGGLKIKVSRVSVCLIFSFQLFE